jgi:hypothetical protein
MDGEVKISILAWEQLRAELAAKTEKLAELESKEKTVKLVLVEKNSAGHYKFNRWTNMNDWVANTHEVERTEYIGLDDVKKVLFEESKDLVQDTLKNLESKQVELEANIRTLNKNHEETNRKNDYNHTHEIDSLNNKYSIEINDIKVNAEAKLKSETEKLNLVIDKLKAELEGKELLTKEEETTKQIADLTKQVADLTKTLNDTTKKLYFWQR